ncbi:MAG: ComEC/Rec2 family competence protein [Asticcacaulis sp.]
MPLWVKALQASLRNVWLSLVASAAATAATTPFAIAYFNRFTLYGLLSNLFEAPITGFIVMPALAVGTVTAATPVGWLALRLAAAGVMADRPYRGDISGPAICRHRLAVGAWVCTALILHRRHLDVFDSRQGTMGRLDCRLQHPVVAARVAAGCLGRSGRRQCSDPERQQRLRLARQAGLRL